MKLASDLYEFVELLTASGAEFLVVGGHAVAWHGYPRFTGDVDLWVRPTEANARAVLSALDAFGFGDAGVDLRTLSTPGPMVQLGVPPNRIDILTEISGVDFRRAWQGRVAAELDGLPVNMIGRTELLENKRASGRPQDLADIAALEARRPDRSAGPDDDTPPASDLPRSD